ncbi:hypothetical protein [Variovorax paradoxus]|uniref:hypothetical protein n=1 Tax=Variovorax paradoxus TaxID=34073 RepID=UPI001F1F215E|nr:hypothetical protein [Variovorax paradoxus]UKI08250.1 hypothetical protein L3V85_36675 [Variovorax paradoxus]
MQVASLRELVIAVSLIVIMQLKPEGVFQSVNQKALAAPASRRESGKPPANRTPARLRLRATRDGSTGLDAVREAPGVARELRPADGA